MKKLSKEEINDELCTKIIVLLNNNNLQKANAITTSKIISEIFEKDHNHIMRDIKNLECTENFRKANFGLSSYTCDTNIKPYKMYNITRDGAMFLIMGFTGKKAALVKEAYIKQFNEMERELYDLRAARISGKIQRTIFTDAIKYYVEEDDVPYNKYAYFTNEIYKHIFGKTANTLRKIYDVKTNDLLRDYLDQDKIAILDEIENKVGVLLEFTGNPNKTLTKVLNKYNMKENKNDKY